MHFTTSLFSVLVTLSPPVSAQDAGCTTTLSQTSIECCGTIAGSTATNYIDCRGCVPTSEPTPLCKCLVAPFTDPALTSTEKACKPTDPVLPANVAAYCKDRAFIAIYPPTREQRCCNGDLRSCDGIVPLDTTPPPSKRTPVPSPVAEYCKTAVFPAIYPPTPAQRCCQGELPLCDFLVSSSTTTTSPISVPTECSYTKCAPDTQCSRCCGGDLRACDGLFPAAAAEPESEPASENQKRSPDVEDIVAIPLWCKDMSFTLQYPPSLKQRCCTGDLRACDGLSADPPENDSDNAPENKKRSPADDESATVPDFCKDVSFTMQYPPTPLQRCCTGDLRACDGVSPDTVKSASKKAKRSPDDDSQNTSGVPEWCKDMSFTMQYPPSQEQQCCAGDVAKCEGLTGSEPASYNPNPGPNPVEPAPACQTTVTKTARPCGDCGRQYETTATVSLACGGCELVTETVTPKGAGVCVCPTETQTSVFACATA